VVSVLLVCLPSVYTSIFIWILLSKILFFVALDNSRGELVTMLQIAVIFDIVMLLSLPLLLMMTRGMCS
jgi:hypothetical protein